MQQTLIYFFFTGTIVRSYNNNQYITKTKYAYQPYPILDKCFISFHLISFFLFLFFFFYFYSLWPSFIYSNRSISLAFYVIKRTNHLAVTWNEQKRRKWAKNVIFSLFPFLLFIFKIKMSMNRAWWQSKCLNETFISYMNANWIKSVCYICRNKKKRISISRIVLIEMTNRNGNDDRKESRQQLQKRRSK